MESIVAESIGLKHEPVAIIFTNNRPEDAKQFKEGKWGCTMFMLAAALRGDTAVFDRKTYGCQGGGVGLGFGNQYKAFAGGEECFCYFLSVGNEQWEQGRQVAEQVESFLRPEAYDNFVHGERYIKSPEGVKNFIDCLPITDVPYDYVIFKPLKAVDPDTEKPEVVVYLGDMDQISALIFLANYHREGNENVIVSRAAGCQTIGIYAFQEAKSDKPRAVLGLNDITARVTLKRLIKDDVMSFTVPWQLYLEMEENVPGSFLERHSWKELTALR